MLHVRYFVATLLVPPFDAIKNVRAGQHERTAVRRALLVEHEPRTLILSVSEESLQTGGH